MLHRDEAAFRSREGFIRAYGDGPIAGEPKVANINVIGSSIPASEAIY